ncbi:MAG: EamA family transporter, partial [Chloroflexota bacterium]
MASHSSRVAWSGPIMVAFGAMLWGADGVLRVPLTRSMAAPAIVLDEHILLACYALPAILLSIAALRKLRATEWLALIGISWGGSALATVLFTLAFETGNPTTVILLQKVQPLFAIILARLLLGEPLSRRFWPWFVLAMAGTYLVSFGTLAPFGGLGQAQAITAALALGAAALWGSATVFG